jgi:hypothetical protein
VNLYSILLATVLIAGYCVSSFAEDPKAVTDAKAASTEDLIQQFSDQISAHAQQHVLMQRFKDGLMTQAEVDSFARALGKRLGDEKAYIVGMAPSPSDHYLEEFLQIAAERKGISDSAMLDMCKDIQRRKLEIKELPRIREGSATLDMNVVYGLQEEHFYPSVTPLNLIWTVSDIRLNGEAIDFSRKGAHGSDWQGNCFVEVNPGNHLLAATVEFALVEAESGFRGAVECDRWPHVTRTRWTEIAEANLAVLATNKAAARPIEDPEFDPTADGSISVTKILVFPGGNQLCEARIELVTGDERRVPISCNVYAKIGGETIPFGAYYDASWTTEIKNDRERSSHYRRIKGGSGLRSAIPRKLLTDDDQVAEVIFVPNPEHIEQYPNVNKIWGKPIEFKDIRLERFDKLFEAKSASDE